MYKTIDKRIIDRILFNGKRVDNGQWVEGFCNCVTDNYTPKNRFYITEYKELDNGEIILTQNYEVDPKTIGRYTTLTDKNGIKIFEGNIVKGNEKIFSESLIFNVVFDEYCRYMIVSNYGHYLLARNNKDVEVIGNIHDNPELLKGSADNG